MWKTNTSAISEKYKYNKKCHKTINVNNDQRHCCSHSLKFKLWCWFIEGPPTASPPFPHPSCEVRKMLHSRPLHKLKGFKSPPATEKRELLRQTLHSHSSDSSSFETLNKQIVLPNLEKVSNILIQANIWAKKRIRSCREGKIYYFFCTKCWNTLDDNGSKY